MTYYWGYKYQNLFLFLDISDCEFICSIRSTWKLYHINTCFIVCSLVISQDLSLFNSLESSYGFFCLFVLRGEVEASVEIGGTSFLHPFILTRALTRSEFLEAIWQNYSLWLPEEKTYFPVMYQDYRWWPKSLHIFITLHVCSQSPLQLPRSIESAFTLPCFLPPYYNQCHQPVLCPQTIQSLLRGHLDHFLCYPPYLLPIVCHVQSAPVYNEHPCFRLRLSGEKNNFNFLIQCLFIYI